MTLTDSGAPQEPRVTDWFRPQRMFTGSGRVVVLLIAVTLVAYHVAWAVSGQPYVSTGLVVLGGAMALVVLLTLLTRVKGGLVTVRGAMYYFLAVAGVAATILGVSFIVDSGQTTFGAQRSALIGTVALVAGVFVFAAGMFLRPARTGLARNIPQDFATQKVTLSDEEAIVRRSRRDFGAGRIERLVETCTSHVKTDDLHYVAYHVDGRCAFYVDVFDHHLLENYFTEVNPERRREEYLRLATHLNEWLPILNRSFDGIDSGLLIRVVLDVERGALYQSGRPAIPHRCHVGSVGRTQGRLGDDQTDPRDAGTARAARQSGLQRLNSSASPVSLTACWS